MPLTDLAMTIAILQTQDSVAATRATNENTAYTTLVGEQFTYNVQRIPRKLTNGTILGYANGLYTP